jgi:hypothetical protein
MNKSASLPYTIYSKTKLFLPPNFDQYKNELRKKFKGVRHTTLKVGPGWLIPVEHEEGLKEFLLDLDLDRADRFTSMEKQAKPIKSQHKYHRATSDNEEEDKLDDEVLQYYKSFSKSPKTKTPERSETESESEEDNDIEPKISKKELKEQIKHLQQQLNEYKQKKSQ